MKEIVYYENFLTFALSLVSRWPAFSFWVTSCFSRSGFGTGIPISMWDGATPPK